MGRDRNFNFHINPHVIPAASEASRPSPQQRPAISRAASEMHGTTTTTMVDAIAVSTRAPHCSQDIMSYQLHLELLSPLLSRCQRHVSLLLQHTAPQRRQWAS